MKKHLFALTASCSLFAANDLAQPERMQNIRPLLLPEEEKSSKLLLSGDFLYWIPDLDHLTFANEAHPFEAQQLNKKTLQLETVTAYNYTPIDMRGEWEPGLRLSAGYLFDEKGWDAVLHWTYFKNDTSTEISSKPEQKLATIVPPADQISPNLVDTAKGKWHLNQNIADIEIGKNYPVGEAFHARPFFGLRGARIESKELLFYTIQTPDTSTSSHISTKSCYWGTGPRVGASADYEMGKGIGVFALGSGAILAGGLNSSSSKLGGIHTVASLQIEVGCQWKRTFQNKYHLGIQAAWEQNFFSGATRPFPQFQDKAYKEEDTDSDLALKGLTASCHLNF